MCATGHFEIHIHSEIIIIVKLVNVFHLTWSLLFILIRANLQLCRINQSRDLIRTIVKNTLCIKNL